MKSRGINNSEIASKFGIHRTTVAQIFARYEKSGDPYHVNPKTGRPRKIDAREIRVAAWLLASAKAANATEVVKIANLSVSRHTLA